MNSPSEPGIYWEAIIESYQAGETVLPAFLGLEPEQFSDICHAYQITFPDSFEHHDAQRQLLADLAMLREQERHDLMDLLSRHLDQQHLFAREMNIVLACACLGSQHLWHDLGMPERPMLTRLFGFYYPELKAMNNQNMRWKRFLYRQLCINGGDYVCRAPSCESCSSFSECFVISCDEHQDSQFISALTSQ